MKWTQARIAGYLTTLFAGVGFVAMVLGAGTYDPTTGLFDLHPIDVKWLAAVIASPASAALATVAAWRGWGRDGAA